MALAVMLMMTLSCRKEQQVNTLNKKGGNTAALRLEPEELEAVTNDFITQSLSEQWNLGTYEYEDAVLMLEGALNYRTCTPHEYYDEIAIDSAAFKISITQDEYGKWNADNEKLIASWTNLLEHAQNTRERLENENYFNIVADLEITDVDLDREEITVSVVIWAGNGSNETICDFTSNDYWLACAPVGGCLINANNNSSNSRLEIQKRLNNSACNIYKSSGCSYFMYISLQGYSSQQFYNPGCYNNCFYYLNYGGPLFIKYDPNWCLSPQDLECSVHEVAKLAYCMAPLLPGSTSTKKAIISHSIDYAWQNWQPYLWYHFATVAYGKCKTYMPN